MAEDYFLEQVQNFKYLESNDNKRNEVQKEIKTHVMAENRYYWTLGKILRSKDLP